MLKMRFSENSSYEEISILGQSISSHLQMVAFEIEKNLEKVGLNLLTFSDNSWRYLGHNRLFPFVDNVDNDIKIEFLLNYFLNYDQTHFERAIVKHALTSLTGQNFFTKEDVENSNNFPMEAMLILFDYFDTF